MRYLIWLFAVLALTAVGVQIGLNNRTVQDRLIERGFRSLLNTAGDRWSETDGLTVFFCGTGSPLPSPTRAQSCTAIVVGGRFFLVDAGTGSWENLQLAQFPAASLQGVFLTHFHTDHIGDLGEANLGSWVVGRPAPLSVYGPTGVGQVVSGFNDAYALDDTYRMAHHGESVAPSDAGGMRAMEFSTPTDGEEVLVFDDDGLRVFAFAVDHDPVDPAVGYRFEKDGRKVVISGDTSATATIEAAARDADLLVHEAQANHLVEIMQRVADEAGDARLAKIFSDIPDYHTTPEEAAALANAASVELLVLNHLTPSPENVVLKKAFMRGVSKIRSDNVVLAEDGMVVRLPAEGRVEIIRP